MKKYMSYAWWIWAILIIGLGLVGACSNNGPIAPDPSDVQDVVFEGGDDDIDKQDVGAFLDEYNVLVAEGGGASIIVDPEPYTLMGAFDRWSGENLTDVHLVVQENGGTPEAYDIDGLGLLSDLVYPITVSVCHEDYVAQTLVETNANVIAFGLTRLHDKTQSVVVFGFTFTGQPDGTPWLIRAASTHPDWDWQTTYARWSGTPHTAVRGNAYQPIGASAFVYEGELDGPVGSFDTERVDVYNMVGFSYVNIGSLEPNTAGGFILNLDQAGTGNAYDTGNYTVTHTFPLLGNTAPISHGTLSITPGGCNDSTGEFVPYYAPLEIPLVSDSGTYDLRAFDPPITADRDVLLVEVSYCDGARETRFYTWDPSGTAVPDIDLLALPECGDVEIEFTAYPTLTFDWTNDPAPGLQVVTVTDGDNNPVWKIFTAGDATQLPSAGIVFPTYDPDLPGGSLTVFVEDPDIQVTRIECAGITPDGFDNLTIWGGTTSVFTSAPEQILSPPAP